MQMTIFLFFQFIPTLQFYRSQTRAQKEKQSLSLSGILSLFIEMCQGSTSFFGKFGLFCFWCRVQNCFFFQPICPSKLSFFIEISMDEITPGVTEMFEFENWYESKFITSLPISQTIRILMQKPKQTVFDGKSLLLVDTFSRAFDGNLRARSYGEMFNLKGKPHQS